MLYLSSKVKTDEQMVKEENKIKVFKNVMLQNFADTMI